jgi:7-keto-8-aminopelargonate synthetase-like enzyme
MWGNAIQAPPAPSLKLYDEDSRVFTGLNFASQDYLSLTTHPAVRRAACEALDAFGPHSAGSPAIQGNTPLSRRLEANLANLLGVQHVVLYPTGWAAGFGVITALVRTSDHVVLDQFAHNCLTRGAAAATPNVHRVRHLQTEAFEARLRQIRRKAADAAVLVVTEGLFSMDADTPDLAALMGVCRRYGADLLVDVAHDFGALGPGGAGVIEQQELSGQIDLVIGSFSKTFATNGGFVGTNSTAVAEYLKFYSPSCTFSNAISPLQCALADAALAVVRSPDGAERRQQLLAAVSALRAGVAEQGLTCLGNPSPIVPVLLGRECVSRLTASLCQRNGLFTNVLEFPAVSVGSARFRMQCMASHTPADAAAAARTIGDSHRAAVQFLERRA